MINNVHPRGLTTTPRAFHRYGLGLFAVAAGIVVLFTLVNTRVNPIAVTPTPWSDPGFREYRPIYRYQRTAKAGLLRSEPWSTVFLGSSRIDIALDPEHPDWGDTRTVNLALSAGTLPEAAAMFDYAAQRQDIGLTIVGIDLADLTSRFSLMHTAGFMESPLNRNGDKIERELRYYSGISTFEASIRAITARSSGKLPEYTPHGHRLRHRTPENVRHVLHRDSIPHAIRFVRERKAAYGLEPVKVDALRSIIDTAKQENCRLVIAIPPNHAAYLSVFFLENDPDPAFRLDRETITRLAAEADAAYPDTPPVEIWDFNGFHPLNAEELPPESDPGAQMHWWMDGTHALKSLGDVMLARIMDWPGLEDSAADYGTRIDATTLDSHLDTIRAGYQQYRSTHPADWNWVCDTILHYSSTGELPDGAVDR